MEFEMLAQHRPLISHEQPNRSSWRTVGLIAGLGGFGVFHHLMRSSRDRFKHALYNSLSKGVYLDMEGERRGVLVVRSSVTQGLFRDHITVSFEIIEGPAGVRDGALEVQSAAHRHCIATDIPDDPHPRFVFTFNTSSKLDVAMDEFQEFASSAYMAANPEDRFSAGESAAAAVVARDVESDVRDN